VTQKSDKFLEGTGGMADSMDKLQHRHGVLR
jgi:hypothetical protein